MGNDTILYRFDAELLQGVQLPVVVVYEHPQEYPNQYAARLYDGDVPTNVVLLADTYEELAQRRPARMKVFAKDVQQDKDGVIESWI